MMRRDETAPLPARQRAGCRRLMGLAALLAALSGCALSKPPSTTQVMEQALPKGTQIPPAWGSSSATGEVAGDWLKTFNDAGLDAIVIEALANNLDLRQAAARVEVARQSAVVVGAQLKPQVDLHLGAATVKDKDQANAFNSTAAFASVFWEIDVWGRLRAQRAAAVAGFEATALDYAYARQSLAATTAKLWYLAIETRQLVALTEQTVSIYADLLEVAKVRREMGKVGDLDVSQASGSLNVAQAELRLMQGLYSEARRGLEVLVGRYPAAELEVAAAFVPVPPPVGAGLPSSLLARRPDLVAAERQVLAAFRTQEAARLALRPSFGLGLGGGRLSDGVLSLLRLNPWMIRAALGMLVPFYQGGALRAQVKITTAQQEQAVARYGGVALGAFREVEDALTNEQLLAERAEFEQQALADHTETVRIANIQYAAGATDMHSVLQFQAQQIASEAELIKLGRTRLVNRINLHLGLGGSFDAAPATAAEATVTPPEGGQPVR